MNRLNITCKILVGLLLATAAAADGKVEIGGPMRSYTLPDQFGKVHTLAPETRAVLIASERPVSTAINTWLSAKENGFLTRNHVEYVSDISPMPAPITKLFALPKMRSFPFRIFLNRKDGFQNVYPRQEARMALFLLDDTHKVLDIRFLEKPEQLDAIVDTNRKGAES